MNLQTTSNQDLIARTLKLSHTERKITHLILQHLIEIENRKLFAELGYNSMFIFLTQHLSYSESAAYRRLQAARLLKQIPEVAHKLENGSLNLTQLTEVQKCLHQELKNNRSRQKQYIDFEKSSDVKDSASIISTKTTNKIATTANTLNRISIEKARQTLEKIQGQNNIQTRQALSINYDQSIQAHTKIIPQKDQSIRLEITLTKEQFAELQTAKDLLSHICPNGQWAEIITTLAKKFNKTKLGGEKINNSQRNISAIRKLGTTTAVNSKTILEMDSGTNSTSTQTTIQALERTQIKKLNSGLSQCNSTTDLVKPHQINRTIENSKLNHTKNQYRPQPKLRPYLSVNLRREKLKLANNCCQYVDSNTGKKCLSKFQLQLDHIQPVALGGSHTNNNLRILCSIHNRLFAEKSGLRYLDK